MPSAAPARDGPIKKLASGLPGINSLAYRKDGSAEVKVDVIIDTLGKADMKTFTVVTTSSPTLVKNVQGVMNKFNAAWDLSFTSLK